MVSARARCYIDAMKTIRPLIRAVTATRLHDMVLTGLAAGLGAWVAPLGSVPAGALAGALAVIALRLAMPGGDWLWEGERLASPAPPRIVHDHTVLDSLPLPVLLLDGAGQVTFASAEAHGLLARDPVGEPVATVFRAPAILAAVERVLAEGHDETVEFTAMRPRRRYLRATVRALEGETRAVLTLVDVSEVHRLDAMRMDFVANASHELRTPLAAITGMV